MSEFKAKFYESIKRTENVFSFRFTPEQKVEFCSGQFVKVVFDREDKNNKMLNKYLSLSNGPAKDYIEVTKKLSGSDFSSHLKNLKYEDEVLFKGPLGTCTLSEGLKKIGFLTGGIGITPVISILEDIVDSGRVSDVVLLYGNWSENDIAFRDILAKWEEENPSIKILHVLNYIDHEESKYLKGFITSDIVKEYMSDYMDRNIFIFGPPSMVDGMKKLCIELGVTKEKLKAENFMGY